MSEKKTYMRTIATAPLWIKRNEAKNVTYFSGVVDFGLLGSRNILVYPRQKKEDEPPYLPEYSILASMPGRREGDSSRLVKVGVLWKREVEKDGRKSTFYTGTLSAGIHGEYSVYLGDTATEKVSNNAPDRTMSISIPRTNTAFSVNGNDDANIDKAEDDATMSQDSTSMIDLHF